MNTSTIDNTISTPTLLPNDPKTGAVPAAPATTNVNDLLSKLASEKRAGYEFQKRKHLDWNDNYELYRNKVKTNRLTQRQAVNIPLMKETIKTLLSRIDDAPAVNWKEKSGDEIKEIVYQSMWDEQSADNKLDWTDVLDKKNVLLYGLSTKKLNIWDNGVKVNVLDVYDILYDPLMNPLDIESARYIIHQNLYRSLRDVLADSRYEKEGKDSLRAWLATENGLVQSNTNKEQAEKKQERLKSMGAESDLFSLFAGGDTIVNITEHFHKLWDVKTQTFEKRVTVYADDKTILLDESLYDLIGVNFWPFTMWSEDPETNDIYPDGVADLVRIPNKVVNVWFSQLVESRTIRNFQMHWYDATIQGYTPQTYEPGPGKMLPAPGEPSKTIMPVEISGLDETLGAINFLTTIIERGSGATAIEKGTPESGQQTLGEVKILVGKAMERTVGMQKFYRGSWLELANKWNALMHANATKKIKLYKTGRSGKMYEKIVYPIDWTSKAGYSPTVQSTSEQEQDDIKGLQKWSAVLMQFPNNLVLKKFGQQRQLQLLDLTPQELKEVQDEEERNIKMTQQTPVKIPTENAPIVGGADLTPQLEQLQALTQ